MSSQKSDTLLKILSLAFAIFALFSTVIWSQQSKKKKDSPKDNPIFHTSKSAMPPEDSENKPKKKKPIFHSSKSGLPEDPEEKSKKKNLEKSTPESRIEAELKREAEKNKKEPKEQSPSQEIFPSTKAPAPLK